MPSHYHSDSYSLSTSGGYRGSSSRGTMDYDHHGIGGPRGSAYSSTSSRYRDSGGGGGGSLYGSSSGGGVGDYGMSRGDRGGGGGSGGPGLMPYPSSSYSGSLGTRPGSPGPLPGSQGYSGSAARQSYSEMSLSRPTYSSSSSSFDSAIGRSSYSAPSRSSYEKSASSRSSYDSAPRSSYEASGPRSSYVGSSSRSDYDSGAPVHFEGSVGPRSSYSDRGLSRSDYEGGAMSRSRFDLPDIPSRPGYDDVPPPSLSYNSSHDTTPGYGGSFQEPSFSSRPNYSASSGSTGYRDSLRDDPGYRASSSRGHDGADGGSGGPSVPYNRGQGLLGAWEDNVGAQMSSMAAPPAREDHHSHSLAAPRVPGGGGGLMDRMPERDRGGMGMVEGLHAHEATDIMGAMDQLTQMNNPGSKLALNILSAVLNKPQQERQPVWEDEPAAKMRRLDWVSVGFPQM